MHEFGASNGTQHSSLSSPTTSLIRSACLRTIDVLPLADENIFQFEQGQVERLLESDTAHKKRVLIDADGVLLSLIDEAIAVAKQMDDPLAERFRRQEEQHRARIVHLLSLVDLIVPKLIEELRFYFLAYGIQFPARAVEAVQRLVAR